MTLFQILKIKVKVMKTCKSSTQAGGAPCDRNNPFISVLFFENGSSCQPEKLRVRRNDVERYVEKRGKCFWHREKTVFSMKGEPVVCSTQFADNAAFVLVKPGERFMRARYEDASRDLAPKLCHKQSETCREPKPECCGKKSQSTPSIPVCARQRSCEPDIHCSRKPKPRPSCCPSPVSSSSESQDECPCEPAPRIKSSMKKKAVKQPPPAAAPPAKTKENRGFFAKLCPCFVKHRQCIPRPESTCGNTKRTQTTKEDFKIAIAKLKKTEQNERKRSQSYASSGRYRKHKPREKPMYCALEGAAEACEDAKMLKKFEIARDKFFQQRIETEEKLAKKLEKVYRDEFCTESEVDE